MGNLSAPLHKQKDKRVHFELYTNGRFAGAAATAKMTLPINPEELTLDRSDRVSVVQTLGAPFIDELGEGLATVRIQGVTGWRTRPNQADGLKVFERLYSDIVRGYFNARKEKQEAGKDPDQVHLVLVNNVDNMAFDVVPMDFHLRRSKSRPLFYQYDLSFTVVEDLSKLTKGDPEYDLSTKDTSLSGLAARVEKAKSTLAHDKSLLEELAGAPYYQAVHDLIEAVEDFVDLAGEVGEVIHKVSGVAAGIVSTVADTLDKGLNAVRNFQWWVATCTFPTLVAINDVKSICNEIKCHFANGLSRAFLPDFSKIYGVTDCATSRGISDGEHAGTPDAAEYAYDLFELANLAGDVGLSGYDNDQAPMMIADDLGTQGQLILSGAATLADVESTTRVPEYLDKMTAYLQAVTWDSTKVADDPGEDLTVIERSYQVTVKEGETFQSIAARELGDARRWPEIVNYNSVTAGTAQDLFFPMLKWTISSDLVAGDNEYTHSGVLPSSYAQEGDRLLIEDSLGLRQWLAVSGVSGQTVTFRGTFSRYFTQPITATRYKDLSGEGVYEGSTTLDGAVPLGGSVLTVDDSEKIFAGYRLYAANASTGKLYTVVSVDHLNDEITVLEPTLAYSDGDLVEIFNAESSLLSLVPGIALSIPVRGGQASSGVQSESEIFGADLALDKNGRLKVSDGDLVLAEGVENFNQALAHLFETPLGSLLLHPAWGCGLDTLKGEKNSAYIGSLAQAVIVDGLTREPRAANVKDVETVVDGDSVRVSATVELVGENTSTDLNYVVGV